MVEEGRERGEGGRGKGEGGRGKGKREGRWEKRWGDGKRDREMEKRKVEWRFYSRCINCISIKHLCQGDRIVLAVLLEGIRRSCKHDKIVVAAFVMYSGRRLCCTHCGGDFLFSPDCVM